MPRDTPYMWTQLERSRFQFITWGCGPDVDLFLFVFINIFYNFYNKYVWKVCIQYTVLGCEPNNLQDMGVLPWPLEHDYRSKSFELGGSLGIVVLEGDSRSKGHGFESRRRILDGHDIFSHWFVVKSCIVCLKRPKINEKRPGLVHFFKKEFWIWRKNLSILHETSSVNFLAFYGM